MALPVTAVTERLRFYTLEEKPRSQEEALRLADAVLTERLNGCLSEGEILSRELTSQVVGDTLLVTLSAECREQVGRFIELPE